MKKQKNFLILRKQDTFHSFLKKSAKTKPIIETGVFLNSRKQIVAFLNYADVLRGVGQGLPLKTKVFRIATKNPIIAQKKWDLERLSSEVLIQCKRRFKGTKKIVRHVPIVGKNLRFEDVSDLYEKLYHRIQKSRLVEVYGLGYVGLTLAAVLASKSFLVHGIDNNEKVIADAQKAKPVVFEPRLNGLIREGLMSKQLFFREKPCPHFHAKTFIVSVGTDLNSNKKANLEPLYQVLQTISNRLQKGSLIIMRSTVPVGTCRKQILPFLEKWSGLRAGVDFSLVYAPERTAEGVAIKELLTLPQIIGGLTDHCVLEASYFWQSLSPSIVRAESLEAAELIKLINNTFRDLSFSFANSLSSLGSRFKIDIHKAILAANEGYPRNPIPQPGPGVGGYCLTKDPYFLMATTSRNARLMLEQARKINNQAIDFPISLLQKHLKRKREKIKNKVVLIIGIAFKGWPETNDVRNSVSLKILRKLKTAGAKVYGYDAVLDDKTIRRLGFIPDPKLSTLKKTDAILILNNHPKNIPDKILSFQRKKPVFIFDGWSLLEKEEIKKIPFISYANMGGEYSP